MVRLNRRDDTVMGPLGKYCCKIITGRSNTVATICINIKGMFRHYVFSYNYYMLLLYYCSIKISY